MTRKLYEIAADIIEAQASMIEMSPDSLEQALSSVFVSLQRMKLAEDGGFLLETGKPPEETVQEVAEKIDPKSSIHEDKVICLECGVEMRQLTANHLSSHGLSSREYKKKYGFPQRQSLSAMSISTARSKAAKKRGLPEKLLQFQERRKQEKVDAAVLAEAPVTTAKPEEKGKTPVKRRAKTVAPVRKSTKKKAE
jgi:predicted transcriptional regulator